MPCRRPTWPLRSSPVGSRRRSETTGNTQVPDRQTEVETLALDAEQVIGVLRREGSLMEIEAVEPQVVTRLDEVFDPDLGAFEAEVVAADLDHGSPSDPA